MLWVNRCIGGMLLAVAGFSAAAQADDGRFITLRNTDSVWLPGNFCSLQFRLDGGLGGDGFGPLKLTLRLVNQQGKTLQQGVMDVKPFADCEATRYQDAYLEGPCEEGNNRIEIVKAQEQRNGHWQALPLSLFSAQNYTPMPIQIGPSH